MLHKTRGIVLSYIKYKESSIIVKVYTELFGIQSYVVNGVRSSKSKGNRIAMFQPLTLLDMVVYRKTRTDSLHRISEIRNLHPFGSLPFDIAKTSLALFITEILVKCLKEEEANAPFFGFLQGSLIELDELEEGVESYHLFFLHRLASYLGFGIFSAEEFVDILREYRYSDLPDLKTVSTIKSLIEGKTEDVKRAGKERRAQLLSLIIFYYRTHIEGFGDVKSLDVLKTVLR